MKIAYLINEYPKVSHSFIRREIQALERRGMKVQRVALRGWKGPLPDKEDQAERSRTQYVLRLGVWPLIPAFVLKFIRSPIKMLRALALAFRCSRNSDRNFAYHLIYIAEACRILPWLSSFGAERIHAHFGTNSTTVVMLARVLGGPAFSFTAHGPEEFLRPVNLAEKIQRASFVVGVSSFGRSQLYLWADFYHWAKIHVIHCGLDRDFYQMAVAPPPSAPRLLCIGRLSEAKGQSILLEAAAMLAAKGIDFEITLAGDGPLRSFLEQQIEQRGLKRCIRLTGWISSEQVRAEILASRALVLPSFAEGLPVVIMEAMALRRPVIATYVAGIPELVTNGKTGWLLPAGCALELADAMERCLRLAPSELQMIGDSAYDRVVQRHSIDDAAAQLARLFNGQADASQRGPQESGG